MTKILDWKKYTEIARRVVAEGCVLLENKDNDKKRIVDLCFEALDKKLSNLDMFTNPMKFQGLIKNNYFTLLV